MPSLSPELQALRDEALAEPKPERYEGMDEYSAEGAMLSAAYFLRLYRYAFITGDVVDLQAMSKENCIFCQSTVSDATNLHAEGGWISPWEEDLAITQVSQSIEDSTIYRVDIHGESGPSTKYSGDGRIVASVTETVEQDIALEMHWDSRIWLVAEGEPQ